MSASKQSSRDEPSDNNSLLSERSAAGSTPRGSTDTDQLREGTVYDVLSNKRRRYVVYMLKQNAERTTIGEMAERVAAWEYDISVQQVMGDQRKRVYTALQQTHLPMMDDAGLIAFNKDRGIVTPEPTVQGIEVYEEDTPEQTDSWSEYYLGLSSAGAVFWLGSAAGAPLLGAVSMSLLAIAFVTIFFGSAVAHWHVHRDEQSETAGKPPEVTRNGSD